VSYEQLNILAVRARSGSKEAIEEIYRHFIPIIEKHSEEIWYKLRDETAFRFECYRQIEDAIRTYDEKKGSFSSLIYKRVWMTKSWFLKKRRIEQPTSLEYLMYEQEEGGFEPEDPAQDVEKLVIEKETKEDIKKKIASLGRGDAKKKMVVTECWSEGLNDTEIAKELGLQFGGTFETNRKFIQRLRNRCRQALSIA